MPHGFDVIKERTGRERTYEQETLDECMMAAGFGSTQELGTSTQELGTSMNYDYVVWVALSPHKNATKIHIHVLIIVGDLIYEVMTSWYTPTKESANQRLLSPVYWSSEAVQTLYSFTKLGEKTAKKDHKTANIKLINKK